MTTTSKMPITMKAIFIICLAASFYIYEFFLRVMPSAMSAELMHYFNITAQGLGIVAALFFYGYTPLQIPAGILIDRFGPRKLLTIGAMIAAICSLLFASTDQVVFAGLSRLFIGIGSSVAYIATLVLATRWFASKHFAFIAGFVQLLGCLGAILGLAPVAALSQYLGWQYTFYIAGGVGILLTLLFWVGIKDYPTHQLSSQNYHKHNNEWQNLKCLLRKPYTWWVGLSAFTFWAPVSIFAELWGVPALTVLYHVNNVIASSMISLFWLGIAVFSPLVGWWSDKIHSRRIPLIIASIVGIICSFIIVYSPDANLCLISIILFIYGFAAASQALTFAVVQDNTPYRLAGTAVGINNTAVVFGGVLLQPLIGFILHALWSGRTLLNLPVYTISNYRVALSILPLCSILGLMINLFFIQETHCQRQY